MSNLAGNKISQRLMRLGEILVEYQELWQPRAFHHLELPWEEKYPELSAFLRSLSYEKAVAFQADDNLLLESLSEYLPVAESLLKLISVAESSSSEKFQYPPWLVNEIPGRKLEQIDAFLNHISCDAQPIVDWCCGKAHLGRLAAYRRKPDFKEDNIVGLEFNENLVVDGNRYAKQHQLPIKLHHVDVLSEEIDHYLNSRQTLLALHACGDLHLQLLRKAVQHNCSKIYFSPCCYHLIADENYQPLSALAIRELKNKRVPLFSRNMLRTAVQQTVTAPHYARAQRETLQAWRLGFDLMRREIFRSHVYLPLPSVPNHFIKNSFHEFSLYMAKIKNINLPLDIDWKYWEQEGWKRFECVTAMDLVRMAFRRAIELWLVMDRAQYLFEHAYKVEILQFCPQKLTPRNILLSAVK